MQHERTQQLESWLSVAEHGLSGQASYVRTRFPHCRAKTYPAFLKWALAAAARQSERTAQFNELYEHHKGIVRKALWRVLRGTQYSDPETILIAQPGKRLQNSIVSDLEAQTWQRIWELLPSYDPLKSKLTTWAFSIALGEARNHRAKRLRRSRYQCLLPVAKDGDITDPLELLNLGRQSEDGYQMTDWSAIEQLQHTAQIADTDNAQLSR